MTAMAELRVSERIRLRLGQLSPSERRIARVLLSGPPTAGLESSTRLAQQAGVSGPTVSRFVTNALGFDNYAAFQLALREEISARVMSPVEFYRQHHRAEAAPDLLARSGTALAEAVAASVHSLDPAEFGRAAALLADGRHQVLAAGGSFSHLAASYLAGVLREIRPGVSLVATAASERAAALADMTRRDVVAVFDFRRYERDTQEFARAAKAAGARIVLFTDPWLSPLAEAADALLTAQFAGPSPFVSLAPAFAVAETLLTAVADALGEEARARFERFGGIADQWIRHWPSGPGEAGAARAE
ncbi:MAG: MurR/RpiR family transcriptional regulator [Actinobacteria bacterium]|nr:MurR/RpiR family transcriptional regulator [Actinomycetota bacterium]